LAMSMPQKRVTMTTLLGYNFDRGRNGLPTHPLF
jgi:hypothetical protein